MVLHVTDAAAPLMDMIDMMETMDSMDKSEMSDVDNDLDITSL